MTDDKEKSSGTPEPEGLSIKANILWNSLGSTIYLACQWLLTVVLVRISGNYDAAGTLSLAISIYNIFAPLALYRMYTYQVSDVRHENTAGEYLTFRIITTGMAMVACLIYTLATSSLAVLPSVLLYTLFKIASLLIDVLHGVDQLHGRMDYIGRSLIFQGVFSFIAFCLVFFFTRLLNAALLSMVLCTIVVGIVYDYPRAKRFEPVKLGIASSKVRYLLIHCLSIVLGAIACSATVSVPRQILASLSGDAALGIYMSVAAPVNIIQMGASYLYNPLLTIISEHYVENRRKSLLKLFRNVALGIGVIGIAALIGFQLLGGPLLVFIFGDTIEPYTYLLLPVVVSGILCAFVWFLNDALVALRCFKGSFVGNIISLIASLALSFPLIMHWDMNGVSFTAIGAYILSTLIMLGFLIGVFKSMGTSPQKPSDESEQ